MVANRFRFRIWDVEALRYYSEKSLAALGICLLPTGRVGFYSFDTLKESGLDYVVEMSTGLLDKNGNEIFEGDILREEQGCFVTHYVNHLVEWKIESKDEDDNHIRSGFTLPDDRIERFEIIGNIYENPGLL